MKKPEGSLRVKIIVSLLSSGLCHRLWNITRSVRHKSLAGSRAFHPNQTDGLVCACALTPGAKGSAGVRFCATAGQEFLPSGRSPCPEDERIINQNYYLVKRFKNVYNS